MNFLSQWLSPKGTVGGAAWKRAKEHNYSPSQIKVAIQQLMQSGVGINNAPGQFYHEGGPMRGVPGIASPKNPLGKFQGPGGNLGQKYYAQAKGAGYDIADIPMLAAQGGMFLPEGAQKQWQMDMQDRYAPPEMPEWEMPGTQSGGGALLGTSAMGVRSNIGSQDNTGGTGEAFQRKKELKKTKVAAQLMANPLG